MYCLNRLPVARWIAVSSDTPSTSTFSPLPQRASKASAANNHLSPMGQFAMTVLHHATFARSMSLYAWLAPPSAKADCADRMRCKALLREVCNQCVATCVFVLKLGRATV